MERTEEQLKPLHIFDDKMKCFDLVEKSLERVMGGGSNALRGFKIKHYSSDLIVSRKDGLLVSFCFVGDSRRWRNILHRAFKNRVFCNASYIIAPQDDAYDLMLAEYEFFKRGVGLLGVSDDGCVSELIPPVNTKPVQKWLHTVVLDNME